MTFNSRAAVSLGIALFAASFLVIAFDYNAKARLLPVFVTSGLLIMALIQFAGEAFPGLMKYMPFLRQQSLLVNDRTKNVSDEVRSVIEEGRENEDIVAEPQPQAASPGPSDTALTAIICVAAMAGMLVLTQFVPYWVAVPVFLMVMLSVIGRQKILISLTISVVTGLALFGLFDLVLNARI